MLVRRALSYGAHHLFSSQQKVGGKSWLAISSAMRLMSSQSSQERSQNTRQSSQSYARVGAIAAALTVGAGVYLADQYKKAVVVDANFVGALNRYARKYYGDIALPKELIEQLSFLQTNSIKTCESNVRLADQEEGSLHIEIKRSLARWNCLALLLKGDESSYQAFISQQPEAERLSRDSFKKISALISSQSTAAKVALEASCFIVMSDKVKSLADAKQAKYSLDSEKFLTDTIRQCPDIYPIFPLLSHQAQQLLPFVYLSNTHGRHMLYTEGGNNMFAELKERIENQAITDEQYQAWFGRWIINIAGFRGHENPHGSIYLTENTARTVLGLHDELCQLQHNTKHDILGGYLQKRAKELGVDSHYLAHLAASMRLYTVDEGKALQAWFDGLSKAEQIQLEQSYYQKRQTLKTTPTYEVAVMDNLLALHCSIAETLNIHSKIAAAANASYDEGISLGKIDDKTPLCFRDIAFKANLESIVKQYRESGNIPTISVNEKGDVIDAKVAHQLNCRHR